MNGRLKTVICIVLSFMMCFLGIGYASVVDTLHITGSAKYTSQYPVYITNVEYYYGNYTANALNSKVYEETFLNSSISLAAYRSYGQTSSAGSYLTVAVTVKNSTRRDYAYQSVTGATDISELTVGVYKDANCTVALNNANGIVAGRNAADEEQTLTFYVRFSHTYRWSARTYNPLLTFVFGTEITEEEEESVGKTVSHKFLEILNTESKYNQLNTAIDGNYDGSQYWTGTFIGNVAGSQNEDSLLLRELFGGTLTLTINDAVVDVTCIIKREDIDSNTSTGMTATIGGTQYRGCEMTLYMTTAKLNDMNYDDYPTVYCMVFTRVSADAEWEQIGEEMYEGTARVVGYMGEATGGSFDTGTWKSSKRYHNKATGTSINDLMKALLG